MHKPGAIVIEGHVQGLSNTRSLGEAGIPVIVVDTRPCVAQHSKYCTGYFKCPDYGSDSFADFLIDLAKAERVKDWVLIPSNDHAVKTISKYKHELKKFYKVITPDWEVIQYIYDKARLIDIAKSVDVPVPETILFETMEDVIGSELSYPVLTKGKNGLSFYKSTGQKAFLSKNRGEFIANLKEIGVSVSLADTFTQELIPLNGENKTISYTAFSIDGKIKTHWAGVKLREHPLQFGTATYAKSIYVEECYRQSVRLLKALNYTGVSEIEYLLDPRTGEYKLIEINARTWLWVGLAKSCGVDYAKIIYDFMQGNDIHYPATYKVDVTWRNPVTDWVYGLLGAIKRYYSLRELYHTSAAAEVNALFEKGDKKPGYSYLIQLLKFYKNR